MLIVLLACAASQSFLTVTSNEDIGRVKVELWLAGDLLPELEHGTVRAENEKDSRL